ncbi:MAG TPA: LysR family transcriptional regulator [Oligoflexus sp.]|uniref:LysR family transcriptional regulator n=1 Tax=Oligoflexus sp. TaxID=1971216 RepID=UPI002D458F3B|nr:LysR family transcriptional regulator [Oligoflexus sp.]HYX37882.1 LysR family transcriptional regulator [Oligoflexus sp.]
MSLMSPQLLAFVAIARHGTVHHAAFELKITQTGVTQRLKTLESQLQVSLFERSRKGMRLTAEGEALLRYCHKVLELEGETLALLDDKSGQNVTQRLSVVGPSSMMRARIIPRSKGLLENFPQLRFTYDLDDSIESAISKLRSAEIQVAVLPPEHIAREMDSKHLRPEAYGLYVPQAWKNRPIQDIVISESIIDFNENDTMTFQFLRLIGEIDSYVGERHYSNNTDALSSMIKAGVGYSVLSDEFVASLPEAQSLARLEHKMSFQIKFALAWYPRP